MGESYEKKQFLALTLAAAMLFTSVPQTANVVYATDNSIATDANATETTETTETDEVVETTDDVIEDHTLEDVQPVGNTYVKTSVSKNEYQRKGTAVTLTAKAEAISSTSEITGYTSISYQWYKATSDNGSSYEEISNAKAKTYSYTTGLYNSSNGYTDKFKCIITVTKGGVTETCNYYVKVTNKTCTLSSVSSTDVYLLPGETATLQARTAINDDVPDKTVTVTWSHVVSGNETTISTGSNTLEVEYPANASSYKTYYYNVTNAYGYEAYMSFYVYKYTMIDSLSYTSNYSVIAGNEVSVNVSARLNNSKPNARVASYQWYTVNEETDEKTAINGATESIYTFTPEEDTKLQCVVTGADGESKIATIYVDIFAGLVLDSPNRTYTYIRYGERATLTVNATSPFADASYTYQWYMGDAKLDGETNSTFVSDRANYSTSTYKCEVTMVWNGRRCKEYLTFYVRAADDYYFTPNCEDYVAFGTTYNLNPTVISGNLSVFWEDESGNVVSRESSFTPGTPGAYTIKYQYNNGSIYTYDTIYAYEFKGDLTEGNAVSYAVPQDQIAGYKFTATKTGKYSFYSTGENDSYGILINSKGYCLKTNDDGGVNSNFKVEYNLVEGQIYYILVRGYNYKSVTGTVTVEFSDTCSHAYTELKNAVAATCSNDGYTGDTCCRFCKAKVHEGTTIPHTGHNLSTVNALNATCTTTGYTGDKVCTTCGVTVEEGTVIPAKGHTTRIENAIEPTCTSTGYTGDKVCTTCRVTVEAGTVIPAKGHMTAVVNQKPASFNNAGYTGDKVCTTCGQVVEQGVSIAQIKTVSVKKKNVTYTGKNVKSGIVVRDAAGNVIAANNYTVTYSKDLKSVGTKKVKVTFHGAYTGSKTVSYNVVPKNVSSVKVTAKTKSLKVSWKKQTKQTSGYEIYYATNKQFKSAKKIDITKTKTTSRIIKSLKKGNTYYVRIRSYKKVGKKKYYSSWSKTQSVKIKK